MPISEVLSCHREEDFTQSRQDAKGTREEFDGQRNGWGSFLFASNHVINRG
jgi:hypothetical protein